MISKLLATRIRKAGVKEVYVMGVIPASNIPLWRRPFWNTRVDKSLQDLNDKLKKSEGAFFKGLSQYQILTEEDYVDELHLTPKGYSKINMRMGFSNQ